MAARGLASFGPAGVRWHQPRPALPPSTAAVAFGSGCFCGEGVGDPAFRRSNED